MEVIELNGLEEIKLNADTIPTSTSSLPGVELLMNNKKNKPTQKA